MSFSVSGWALATLGQISGFVESLMRVKFMTHWGWVVHVLHENYEPYAMLQWSDDGGYTWSVERWESMGRKGEYKTRMHWHGLGHARDRIFRVAISQPVKVVLINAVIEARKDNDK